MDRYHKYHDLLKLYEADKRTLDDIWDEDWFVIQSMLFEKQRFKEQKEEEAKRIEALLGSKGKKKDNPFPKLR